MKKNLRGGNTEAGLSEPDPSMAGNDAVGLAGQSATAPKAHEQAPSGTRSVKKQKSGVSANSSLADSTLNRSQLETNYKRK